MYKGHEERELYIALKQNEIRSDPLMDRMHSLIYHFFYVDMQPQQLGKGPLERRIQRCHLCLFWQFHLRVGEEDQVTVVGCHWHISAKEVCR